MGGNWRLNNKTLPHEKLYDFVIGWDWKIAFFFLMDGHLDFWPMAM